MTKGLIKRFSYGAAFAFVVLLILLAAGAMFFTDDIKEEFLGHPEYKNTQVMEIRGNWLGMRMISLDSPTARRSGVPPSERGVMVVEIEDKNGWRARQAGVREGDVIVAVNGKDIRDLADLYDLSCELDAGPAIFLNVLRWGQPMTLVLPAVYAASSVANQPQAELEFQTAPMTAQGGNAGTVQPAALVPAPRGPMFHCPIHNRVWSQNEVHPHYRCPLGNGPLNRVPSLPQAEQVNQLAPMTAQRENAGAAQPAALVPAPRGPMFNCPIHNRAWPQNEVHPHYRCPLCYYQLNRVR